MTNPRLRGGRYQREAPIVRARANADPSTRCGRCGLTLAEHRPHHNGTPARWDAGHVIDGDPLSPLRPEASVCNRPAGARLGNARRATGYAWP